MRARMLHAACSRRFPPFLDVVAFVFGLRMIVRPWLVRVWQSLKEALRDKERELEEADLKAKERKHNDKKVAMLSDRLKKAWEEAEFHKQCNASLTANDEAMKAKLAAAASKDLEIQELQEQVRDLMFFLEAQKSVEASEHGPDIKEGQIVMQASPAARRRSKGSGGKSPHGAAGAT